MADEPRERMERAVTTNTSPAFGESIQGAPISEVPIGTCGTAIYEGRPISCADVSKDERWSPAWRDLCLSHGIRAGYSTPIFDISGKAIASFFLGFANAHEPTAWEQDLGRTGAHIASVAIGRRRAEEALRQGRENYRMLAESLDGQVRERTRDLEQRNAEVIAQSEQMRALSAQILQAQDKERQRIARELHDSAGQLLVALQIEQSRITSGVRQELPDLAKHVDEVEKLTQQLTRELRTTSYLLHPPMLDESGLVGALRWYAEGLTARGGIKVDLRVSDDLERLPADAELCLFRIVQECLTNIHRHSGSKDAVIQLTHKDGRVFVEIEDHGKGIPPEKLSEIQSQGGGVGVRGMRERLHQFDGELSIQSTGCGTKVCATLRLPALQSHPSEEVPIVTSSFGPIRDNDTT